MTQTNANRSLTPFEEFSTDIERMFDSLLGRTVGSVIRGNAVDKFNAHLDVVETDKDYSVTVDLPGVKPEDVKVELEDGKLTISGSRETVVEEKAKHVHRVERSKGSFHRMISIPREIDAENIQARFEHGVLHVQLPKVPEKQPKKIEIRTAK